MKAAAIVRQTRRMAASITDETIRAHAFGHAAEIAARLEFEIGAYREAAADGRAAAAYARTSGEPELRTAAETAWSRAVAALGEQELAVALYTQANPQGDPLTVPSPARAVPKELASRLASEWSAERSRFDEVVFSTTAAVVEAQNCGGENLLSIHYAVRRLLHIEREPSFGISGVLLYALADLMDIEIPPPDTLLKKVPPDGDSVSVVVHPALRLHVEAVVNGMVEAAATSYAIGRHGEGAAFYMLASESLILTGDLDGGLRYRLYAVDGFVALNQLPLAEQILAWVDAMADPTLKPAVVVRYALVAIRSPLQDADTVDARLAELEAMRRRISGPYDADAASIDLILAEVQRSLGNTSLARTLYERILEFVRGTVDEPAIHQFIESLNVTPP